MTIAIIAGNRLFPILLAEALRSKFSDAKIIGICFRGETSKKILKYLNKAYWINVGQLQKLKEILEAEEIKNCIMAGQINPLKIFNKKLYDTEFKKLIEQTDFRPHSIFRKIIEYLERYQMTFLDSTQYLKEYLATYENLSKVNLNKEVKKDIEFGLDIMKKYVSLDVGQTMVVKSKSVVALEALEGTDRTILRAYKLAGSGCVVFKFSRPNQDMRFDVPVVGLKTIQILKRTKAAALILEAEKVLILEKEKFIQEAQKAKIPVVGEIL